MKELGQLAVLIGLICVGWIAAGLLVRILAGLFMLGWGVLP